MNKSEQTILDFHNTQPEPTKSLVQTIYTNGDNADRRRAQALLNTQLTGKQTDALIQLSASLDKSATANEESGKQMAWLTKVLIIFTAVQALSAVLQLFK